nr:MAG TPA: holin [Caudoviricetes sp.]
MDFAGLTLSELVQIATLTYTALLILGAIPKAMDGVKALMDRFRSRRK